MEERAFAYCISLVCLALPPIVTEINNKAFLGCTQLRSVILQNGLKKLKRLGDEHFPLAGPLKASRSPPSVTDIENDCDNILSGYLSVVTTVFSQQDGIYGFKFPKRFFGDLFPRSHSVLSFLSSVDPNHLKTLLPIHWCSSPLHPQG